MLVADVLVMSQYCMTLNCVVITFKLGACVFQSAHFATGAAAHLSHLSQISRLNLLIAKIQRQISVGMF